jgi:hypothetical protein
MSIVGAALVPAAPVLLPALSGREQPAAVVLNAALCVIRQLIDSAPAEVMVLAEADRYGVFDTSAPWGLHRLGGMPARDSGDARATCGEPLPVPLAIGAALLRLAGWTGPVDYHALDRSLSPEAAIEYGRKLSSSTLPVGLLLLGNGSACCTDKAPGSFHSGAQAFNEALTSIIRTGDQTTVEQLSAEATAEQLSDIRLPLQVLAGADSPARLRGSIAYDEPFMGVHYICAAFLPVGTLGQ